MWLTRIIFSFIFTITYLYSIKAQKKMYKSEIAHKEQFPYVGYIKYYGKQKCGATIIHRRWAITAAHCISTGEAPTLTVGPSLLTKSGKKGRTYGLEDIIIHEEYRLHYNDIVLLRTGADIKFNSDIQPVTLPKDLSLTYENATAVLAGWGNSGPTQESLQLHYGLFRVLSQKECAKNITETGEGLVRTHLCISGIDGANTCEGDSGSPVTVMDILVGIVSGGAEDCGVDYIPTLTIRIAPYMPWIREKLRIYDDELP